MSRVFLCLALLALGSAALMPTPSLAATEIACMDANNQPQTVSPTNPCPVVISGTVSTPTGTAGTPNAAVTTVQGIAGGTPQPVTLLPTTGTPTESTVTCGVTTTTLLAAAAATQFILIKVPTGGGTVWLNVAGVAAVAAPPSIDLTGGASQLWSPGNGYVPASQINCIAPVAQAVSLVYK